MDKRKREKGSITLITIVTVLFMLAFLIGTYTIMLNRRQAQIEVNKNIKESYEKEVNNADDVYNTLLAKTQNTLCKHEFENNVCKKCGLAIVIGANIVGYDPSIGENGKAITTSYQVPTGNENDDGTVESGSGYSTRTQTFTVDSITKWKVLRVDGNQIVIISADQLQTDEGYNMSFKGKVGFASYLEELNKICNIYGQGKYADTSKYKNINVGGNIISTGSRAVTYDDFEGTGRYSVTKSNKSRTYTKNANGNILDTDGVTETTYTLLRYWGEWIEGDGEQKWRQLSSNNSITFNISGEGITTIESGTNLKSKMVCYLSDGVTQASYFISSIYVNFYSGYATYGIRMLYSNQFKSDYLYATTNASQTKSYGIRPIVYLKDDVKLSYDETTQTYTIVDEYRGTDKYGATLAKGANTTPYLPDNNSEITNNDLSTGLTVKDSNGNEWVWIEVPRTSAVYATAGLSITNFTDSEYQAIRTDLENYAMTLIPEGNTVKNQRPSTWKDYWYYMPSSGTVYSKDPLTGDQYKNNTANSDDISTYITSTDGTKGTGLKFSQYQTKYKAMLKSVYENGGFYIGKYETGTITARGNQTDALTTPVIKENAYPYEYVTVSQAESLAESIAPTGKTTSLLFGVQWDLVLKHLSNKGVPDSLLKDDSSTWGNYNNQPFEINRGAYSTASPWNVFTAYTTATANKVTVENGASRKVGTTSTNKILLTTGASDTNSKYDIYDLAGNVWEWTLEKTSDTSGPCAGRGGSYSIDGSIRPASVRDYSSPARSDTYLGFRVALY